MKDNLTVTTEWLLVHEGGYVNHPNDPGGPTNLGVTQRVYDGYRRKRGHSPRSVKQITKAEVYQIYKLQYWDKVWGDNMPHGLDYALYDFAVNSGPSRAVKFIQRIVGVAADGIMGMITYNAIMKKNDIEGLIADLCLARWNWMKRLSTWRTFGKGWTRRVMGNIVEGVQAGSKNADTGVIDRSTWLFRQAGDTKNIQAPIYLDDGANERPREEDMTVVETVKEGTNLDNATKIAAGSLPAWLTAVTGLPPGPLQYAAAGLMVLAGAVVAYWAVKRLT